MLKVRTRKFISLGLFALGLTGAVLAWVLWPHGDAESQQTFDPVAVQPVLQQLGPGTTLHIVDVVYRRYGPAAAQIPASEGPEQRRIEHWFTFDDQGALADVRIEIRDINGTLLTAGALDGEDLVFHDTTGSETKRQARVRGALTVEHLKRNISTAITKTHEALSNRPDAPTGDVDGRAVVILEDRRPLRVPVGPQGTGFRIPQVADLNPVDEVRRAYVLPGEFRTLRSEVVIVGGDDTETVVESRHHEVFEVLQADGG